MKHLSSLLFSGALLVASGGCYSSDIKKPVSICGGELSCEEVGGPIESALSGSPEAALELFWASLDKGEKEEALYWARIAMENGSQAGRHNYASLLIRQGDARSLQRARYHLKILVRQGDKDAAVLLEEAERKISKDP